MIKNYFKIAFRGFWRHKLFTLINIIGLSIGISAALVIYLIVHFDFTFDKFHRDGDRIYRVVSNFSSQDQHYYNGGVCGPLPEAVKNEVTGLTASAPFFIIDQFTFNQTGVVVPGTTNPPVKFKYQEDQVLADQRYFSLFQYNWLAGSARASLNEPFKVVLTDVKAKKYFPSLTYQQMLGKEIVYGDSIKTTVSGIVEAQKGNTDFDFNDFISYSTAANITVLKNNLALTQWGGTTPSSQFFVKLSEKSSVAGIEKQLNGLLKSNQPKDAEGKGDSREFALQKLSDIHFDDRYGAFDHRVASRTALYGLLIVGAFLLILACINFINLTTAQSSQRAKEIGIRKTMGGNQRQLITQFLGETFFITLVAVTISAILSPLLLKLFADFIPTGITADLINQPDLVVFLALLTIVVSLFSGFYPAVILSAYKPVDVLKNQAQSDVSKTRNAWFRKSLTVTQFAIAQFFIMATILVSKQTYYALHKDLGFKKDAIVYIPTPWNSKNAEAKQVFMNKVRALPQVEMTAFGGASPSSDNTHSRGVTYIDGKNEIKTDVQERFGDENYVKIYKIKLLAGRNIEQGDISKALLINSMCARTLGFKTPAEAVGRSLNYGGNKMQIVGVTGDFYYRSLHSPITPLVIVTSTNSYFTSTLHIALKPELAGSHQWQKAISAIGAAWKASYPDADFDYHFFDESIAKFYEEEQHTSTLLTWATGLSISISCLGLLGLAIYTTTQRTKEIGVRKVLGATVAQIVTLLSTELVLLIVLAFIIVTPVAWWAMNKWMQTFADRTAISWWIFAASGAGMLLAAVFTSSFQTIKAAIANPVKSLRSE